MQLTQNSYWNIYSFYFEFCERKNTHTQAHSCMLWVLRFFACMMLTKHIHTYRFNDLKLGNILKHLFDRYVSLSDFVSFACIRCSFEIKKRKMLDLNVCMHALLERKTCISEILIALNEALVSCLRM